MVLWFSDLPMKTSHPALLTRKLLTVFRYFIDIEQYVAIMDIKDCKYWRKKLWRIGFNLPNSPKFFIANVFYHTVFHWTIQSVVVPGDDRTYNQHKLKTYTRTSILYN